MCQFVALMIKFLKIRFWRNMQHHSENSRIPLKSNVAYFLLAVKRVTCCYQGPELLIIFIAARATKV